MLFHLNKVVRNNSLNFPLKTLKTSIQVNKCKFMFTELNREALILRHSSKKTC